MIPPQELQDKTFTRVLRGYEPAEVDEYINFLVDKYTEIFKQCEIYDRKLRIVSQKIAEIQEKEDEIQSREEVVNKSVMYSRQDHDKIITDAEKSAAVIIENAEKSAEKILADARQRAQTALAAIERKLNMQIESTQEKSDALLLSARTRCTKLLSDFKKEISHQKENIINLKNTADSFSENLIAMYKHQMTFVTDSFYVPNIDFEKFTDSQLFDIVMKELRSDAADIAKKSGDTEYDFEKELGLLKETEDNDEDNESGYKPVQEFDAQSEKDEDVKVFPRKNQNSLNNINNINGAEEKPAEEHTVTFNKPEQLREPEEQSGQEYYEEEKPIATYDSDDYDENQYNKYNNRTGANDNGAVNPGGYSYGNEEDYADVEESEEIDEIDETEEMDEEIENEAKGFFGLFKKKKKKKPKFKNIQNQDDEYIENGDDESEYYGIDEDDDDENMDSRDDREVMNIFSGLDDDE